MKSATAHELETAIRSTLQEVSQLKNKVIRKEQEKQDQLRDMLLAIIDIVDSFERVEEGLAERGLDKSEEGSRVMKRYKGVHRKLMNVLNINGVEPLTFPNNQLVVGFSRVVDTVPDNTKQNDEIITIIRNGYVRGDELIREAEVITVKN